MHSPCFVSTGAPRRLLLPILCGVCFFLSFTARGQEPDKRAFDLPAGTAEKTLKLYSQQSGRALIMSATAVKDVKTNEVRGEFAPREALDRMLANTGLEVVEDAKSGSLAVRKVSDPNAQRAAQTTESDRPSKNQKAEMGVIKLDTFEVMGTKLLNMDIPRSADDAQPYVIFDKQTITNSGAADLDEFLKQRLTSNTVAKSNDQTAASNIKTSQINLRGLGTNQTLILIDGHRAPLINNFGGTAQADLNGIPLAAIERIEILPTTASGIYGGGATGGVVNVILRRDYQGAELKLNYGNTFDSDVSTYRIDFSSGVTLENGKTNVLFSGSSSHTNDLLVRDRDFVQKGRARILANNPGFIYTNTTPPPGAASNIRSVNGSPLFGPGSPNFATVPVGYSGGGGLAIFQATAGTYNLDLAPSANASPTGGGALGLLPASTNSAFSAVLRRQFSPRLQLFASFSNSSNVAHTYDSLQLPSFTIAATAPNNPFGQAIRVTAPILEANGYNFSKNETTGFTGGLIFKLSSEWTAEADYTWNTGKLSWTSPPVFSAGAATAISNGTLDLLRDIRRYPLDFSPYLQGQPNELATSPDFGTDLRDAVVRVSGQLGSLPAGPIKVSSLIEYQKTDLSNAQQNIVTTAATTFLYPEHSQSVQSAYLEAHLPVVAEHNHIPGINELELQVAARGDLYSSHGASPAIITNPTSNTVISYVDARQSSINPTFAIQYKPTQEFMIRASYGTGFLVPDLSQLAPGVYTPVTAGTPLIDRMRGNTTFSTYQSRIGGSPDLKPEKSKSFSTGVVYTSNLVEGLRASLDYTKINKTDNIITPTPQQLLDNEALLPGRVSRGANLPGDPAGWAGQVISLDQSALNIATAEVEAYDVQIDYTKKTREFGAFDFFTYATWETHYKTQVAPSVPVVENVGVTNANPLKFKANAGLTWRAGLWKLGWTASYFDSYLTSTNPTDILNLGNGGKVPSQIYHDLFVSYRFPSTPGIGTGLSGFFNRLEVQAGVQNIFNAKPPVELTSSSFAYYSWFGDPRLARYSISVKKTF